jgi:hypothetical protein
MTDEQTDEKTDEETDEETDEATDEEEPRAEAPLQTEIADDVASARRATAVGRLRTLIWIGAPLYGLGSVIFAIAFKRWSRPGIDADTLSGGPIAGMYVGGFISTVGVALLLVAMIGWAVKLGREAAEV